MQASYLITDKIWGIAKTNISKYSWKMHQAWRTVSTLPTLRVRFDNNCSKMRKNPLENWSRTIASPSLTNKVFGLTQWTTPWFIYPMTGIGLLGRAMGSKCANTRVGNVLYFYPTYVLVFAPNATPTSWKLLKVAFILSQWDWWRGSAGWAGCWLQASTSSTPVRKRWGKWTWGSMSSMRGSPKRWPKTTCRLKYFHVLLTALWTRWSPTIK